MTTPERARRSRDADPVDAAAPRVRARLLGVHAVMLDVSAPTEEAVRDTVLDVVAGVRSLGLAGVVDVVPARASVLVVTADRVPAADVLPAVRRLLSTLGRHGAGRDGPGRREPGRLVELPVVYDGDDLGDVAAWAGVSVEEVVSRHSGREHVAAFAGFAPGFVYLTGVDPVIAAPRLATPRTRVPGGAVALAGDMTAVYPAPSPGGWRLLGRTSATMFDAGRSSPALVVPGDRVRFVRVAPDALVVPGVPGHASTPPGAPVSGRGSPSAPTGHREGAPHEQGRWLEVLAPGPLALVEDDGRLGVGHLGVGRSGAADRGALHLANRLLGNPEGAAAIEVLLGGLRVRFGSDCLVVLTGAPAPAWLDDRPVGHRWVLRPRAGEVLRLGMPSSGLRTYLGVRGGIDVAAVLGSRATDVLAHLGPAALSAGDVVGLGRPSGPFPGVPGAPLAPPAADDVTRLHLRPGVRGAWFGRGALAELAAHRYTVDPDSDRVAVRLAGPAVALAPDAPPYRSEGLVRGAVQVPPDGRPVVFLADHPPTGGYPVVGVVEPAGVDALAQCRPGDAVRWQVLRER